MTAFRNVLLASLVVAGLTSAPPRLHADDKDETAGRARAVFRRYCQTCHAGPADQITGGLEVLDHGLLLRRKVVRLGDAAGSLLYRLVECGSMPPGDLPKPGPADVQTLRQWIAEGAPDFPPEFGDAYVLKEIQKDLATLNAEDVPYQRYVSFNHLAAEDPAADRGMWRDALLKALNHLSWEPQPAPVRAIDPPADTVFRVDERRLGWDLQPFETPEHTPSKTDLFDLILLEYPFATLPARFAGEQRVLADYLHRANPVRPILYVRGDWLVGTATQPPLYEDLLRLPRTLTGQDGLEAKIKAADKSARAGLLKSEMSKLPELVERREASAGAYWRTFDVGQATDMQGLLRHAGADAERGGLMLFSLPNGFNGYYIAENVADENSQRLTRLAAAAPAEWAADPLAADGVARNGLSCMRCHASGVPPFRDALRPALDGLTPAEKDRLLPLFPGAEAMDKLAAGDADRFRAAVKAIHGRPLDGDPLTPLTRRFLLHAGAESVAPALLAGDVPPAAAPVAAGDKAWPDPHRFLAPDVDAPPLPPLDGLTLPDYQSPLPPVDVTIKAFNLKTKEETTAFRAGDQLTIDVTNRGKGDAWIELIFLAMDGRMTVHQPPKRLPAGATYHYPKDRPNNAKPSVEMALPPGVDRYLLFASDMDFPAGVRLRSVAEKGVADRVVHPFWAISPDGSDCVVAFDPSRIVKKTLAVETRVP